MTCLHEFISGVISSACAQCMVFIAEPEKKLCFPLSSTAGNSASNYKMAQESITNLRRYYKFITNMAGITNMRITDGRKKVYYRNADKGPLRTFFCVKPYTLLHLYN